MMEASALVLMSLDKANELGITPLAKIVSYLMQHKNLSGLQLHSKKCPLANFKN